MQTGFSTQQSSKLYIGRFRVLVVVFCLVASGCATNPAVGDPARQVTYQVTWLATPEGGVGPTRAVLRLDEEFAVLDGNTGCHRILGSFTLNDITGKASFTVPGASRGSCSEADRDVEDLLLTGLDQVVSFERSDQGLLLTDSAGNLQIELEKIS